MPAPYPAVIDLTTLDGTDGFRIDGEAGGDHSGVAVAGGDINGDGYSDLIIAAYGPNAETGVSYVVFGGAGFSSSFNLADLTAETGIRIDGINPGDADGGMSVGFAGDVNGDGYGDFIVGTPHADPGSRLSSGQGYVVFGGAGPFTDRVVALNGNNGFMIDNPNQFANTGASVAGGDVNGDGVADMIVGAWGEDEAAGSTASGATYVVFGHSGAFRQDFQTSDIDGKNGFRLAGVNAFDSTGLAVAFAGDVNGDGFGDILVGGEFASPGGTAYAGVAYVVYGKAGGFAASMNLGAMTAADGFRIDGLSAGAFTGSSVAGVGDVNGDGFADFAVGANGAASGAGVSYVVFGHAGGFGTSFDLSTLNGANGFSITGGAGGDSSGWSVSSAGDFNGDGFNDLLIGAYQADGSKGDAYVVFGQASGFAADVNLSALDGSNGFRLAGGATGDAAGYSVSAAGDVNGDGLGDLIVGAYGADGTAGSSYVVFGSLPGAALTRVGGAGGQTIWGSAFNDTLSGLGGDDVLIGGAGDDTLDGGAGRDTASYRDAGSAVTVGIVAGAQDTGGGGVDTLIAIENLTGSKFDDTLTGDARMNVLQGGGGNDTLNGMGGVDTASYADTNAGVTVTIKSGAQDTGGAGVDTLIGIENLTGSRFADTLTGNAGANRLEGGSGADTLNGGQGADMLMGGTGDDVLIGGRGDDVLNGGSGFDTASYAMGATSGVTVSLTSGAQNTGGGGIDTLYGIENLTGSQYGDTLTGNGVHNVLNGGLGDDVLTGGAGGDVLIGGMGADRFVYTAPRDSKAQGDGLDQILDFRHGQGDKIDLSQIDAIPGGPDDAFVLVGVFTHQNGQLIIQADATGYMVKGDTNGDGFADFGIHVASTMPLTAADFIL